ncbi:MAG: type II restriction endonuclease [Lachnospiraceae bacterium]|nr:type II restriction endonuclease [Lachnospiraceae bacterium]
MKRDFEKWFRTFTDTIASYDYYVDFKKVYSNVDDLKIELNILNSLIGSKNIKKDFESILNKYPEIVKCIPILIAVREKEITAMDEKGKVLYNFRNVVNDINQYSYFMEKTGVFDLLSNHIINNLYDYVTGVETGLDSNGRKNRGGHLMENLVESYIVKAGFIKDNNYFKEMYISDVQSRWGIDLSAISNQGKTEKRFDFVIKTKSTIYGIETNFYSSGGSKLNETARSYKQIAEESKNIKGFKFVWFTDGEGWIGARNNLAETFEVLEHLYNINDLNNNVIIKELI